MRSKVIRQVAWVILFGAFSSCSLFSDPEEVGLEVDYSTDRSEYAIGDSVRITLTNIGAGPIEYSQHRFIREWRDGVWSEGLGFWPVETAIILEPHYEILRRNETVTDLVSITKMGVEIGGTYRLVREMKLPNKKAGVLVESEPFSVRD